MKTTFRIGTIILVLAGLTAAVKAQSITDRNATEGSHSGIRLSIGPEFGIPVGKLSDTHDWSFGGSVQGDFPVAPSLFVTANAGYNNIFGKSDNGEDQPDLRLIPVKAGLKYFATSSLYVQAEAGASFITNKSDLPDGKSAAFVYAPQIGFLLPFSDKSFLDAGVRFEGNTKFYENGKSNNFFGLRVAYSFSL